jgi:hypothetical protein
MYQGCPPIIRIGRRYFSWFVQSPRNSGPSGFRNRTIRFCRTWFNRIDFYTVHRMKTGLSGLANRSTRFFQKTKFSVIWSKTWCLLRQIIRHYIFNPGNMLYNKITKRAIIFKHLSRYAFKDPSIHWKVSAICCMTNNESSNAFTCFTPMEVRIYRPNRMTSYSAWLLVTKFSKWTDCSKTAPLGEIKTIPTPWPSLHAEPSKNNFYGWIVTKLHDLSLFWSILCSMMKSATT